jgi:hypothetical protein
MLTAPALHHSALGTGTGTEHSAPALGTGTGHRHWAGLELGNEQNTQYTGAQIAANFAILHNLTREVLRRLLVTASNGALTDM